MNVIERMLEQMKSRGEVSTAVVDQGGALLHFCRLDGARPYSVDLAIRKARTAMPLALSTQVLEAMTRERLRAFF
jgi:uncharacterized protein GlcG (DUF336 family)